MPFQVDVITLSPPAVVALLAEGVVGRAVRTGKLRLRVWQLREFSRDPHRKVDDLPYGGGPGMVLMPEPLVLAGEHALDCATLAWVGPEAPQLRRVGGLDAPALGFGDEAAAQRPAVVVLAASGQPFTQRLARELAAGNGLVVLCGRYEGMDARVAPALGALEVGVGEFVASTGEAAACCLIDAVVRLLPGVVGDPASVQEESFGPPGSLTEGLLEYPHYTRPRVFRGMEVPEVLLHGDHGAIARWRRQRALELTLRHRPHLLAAAPLTEQERHELFRRADEGRAPAG